MRTFVATERVPKDQRKKGTDVQVEDPGGPRARRQRPGRPRDRGRPHALAACGEGGGEACLPAVRGPLRVERLRAVPGRRRPVRVRRRGRLPGRELRLAEGYSHSAGDFRVVVVKPTSTCRAKFAATGNPYAAFTAARTTAQMSKVERLADLGLAGCGVALHAGAVPEQWGAVSVACSLGPSSLIRREPGPLTRFGHRAAAVTAPTEILRGHSMGEARFTERVGMMKYWPILIVIVFALSVTACGGGGGSGEVSSRRRP